MKKAIVSEQSLMFETVRDQVAEKRAKQSNIQVSQLSHSELRHSLTADC